MPPRLRFLGAAGTVTGSKYLLHHVEKRYLLEAGLFQGDDALEQQDWKPFPIPPKELDAVLLTHAHIDHTGYLPRLVAEGCRAPVYATRATMDLLDLLLPDSGRLQEEQAAYANKKGYARHLPAKPLYTEKDAELALRQLRELPMREWTRIDADLDVRAWPAGHILGSASLELRFRDGSHETTLVASGDVGRYAQPVMNDPVTPPKADVLLLESTYGDRLHSQGSPAIPLRRAIAHIEHRGGVLVIPSFAVGRAQHILYHIHRLQDAGELADIPIFLDSPMSIDATDLYCRHGNDPNLRLRLSVADARCPIRAHDTRYVRSTEESMALNERKGPAIIISANGMCTGGRIRHHLKHRLHDKRNAVLFIGYQARGTLGQRLRGGAKAVRIHGHDISVHARIFAAEALSAHADQDELLRWLRGFERPPRATHLVHGEPEAREALAARIARDLGWKVALPDLHDEAAL